MRLTSLRGPDGPYAALVTSQGTIPISSINQASGHNWPTSVQGLIEAQCLDDLRRAPMSPRPS